MASKRMKMRQYVQCIPQAPDKKGFSAEQNYNLNGRAEGKENFRKGGAENKGRSHKTQTLCRLTSVISEVEGA